MPLVRIEVPKGRPQEYRRAIGDVVYEALIEMGVPRDDRFQIITEHDAADLVIDPTYAGIERGPDAMIIQITLNEGRALEKKKALFKSIADGLHSRVGLRREDVMINLVEVAKENWSFGLGLAQYA